MYGQKKKKWSLAHSKLHWVTVSPKKVWTLCWILPFAPPATGTYPSPLRHAIQHRYCTKRRPLSTLLKSYRVKTLLLGNRKTILQKWIIAVSFKFWFHRLHVLFLVTKVQVLRWNFHVIEQKISFLFPGRPFSPSNSLPGRNFIQVSYNILFVCFGHEDPLSLQLLRILESNNANIPYAQLSYNIDFKAQQGKIGKKIYFQSFTRNWTIYPLLHREK